MTIAAANFMAVLTGASPAPAASATPTTLAAGFSDAIGTALANGPIAGLGEALPTPAGAPASDLALPAALTTVLAGGVPATTPASMPFEQPVSVTAEFIPRQDAGKEPAVAAQLPAPALLPGQAGALIAQPSEEPTASEIKPHGENKHSDGEAVLTDIALPDPEPAEIQLTGEKAVLDIPVARPIQAETSVAAEQLTQAAITVPAQPGTSRVRRMADADTANSLTAPQGTPGFAERVTASAASAITPAPAPDGAVPSTLQTNAIGSDRPSGATAEAAPQPAREQPTIEARPGRIGRDMGVEIARHLSAAGGEELTVRLNPVEMGRIEVRLSFDDRGTLRAVVAAESAAALDMLRRDHADLGRALTDAGVRSDAQSFRFDSRSGGGDGGQFWQRQQQGGRQRGHAAADEAAPSEPVYRTLRASGRVDLMA